MPHGLTIACGAAFAALLIGCYLTRGAGSSVARVLRRAVLFIAPLLLVSVLFSMHQYGYEAAVDIVRPTTTIGQLEDAIDRVRMPQPLHEALRGQNSTALAAGLLVLAALVFVRPGLPCLGIGRRAAAGVGTAYVAVTVIVAGALLGHGAVRDIDAGIRRLQIHIGDIERKAGEYQRDVEEEAREIVRNALIQALDVGSIQTRLDAVRADLRASREVIEPFRELLQAGTDGFGGATLESDFADTWNGIRGTVNTLHWDRKPAKPAIPDGGRSNWSTLRLYEAGTGLRNDRLSRAKEEAGELDDVVAKTFDLVYAAGGKPELDAALDVDYGHPLAPLVVALVEVWHEPLKALWAAQAKGLFDATLTQGQPFPDAAATARAQVLEAMTALKADLQPGLDQIARRLQRLQGEAARLPQSLRRFAESAFPERLKTFRGTWRRVLSFSTPAAARAAAALRLQAEAVLEPLPDPVRKHEQLAAYERALQALAGRLDDPARYQALLGLEQQHLDTRDFARFTRDQVESWLATRSTTENDGPADEETLPRMEARSQWLETHRLAADGLLDRGEGTWQPEDRDRILSHLAFDLRFLTRAILENYRPQTYTPDTLRNRIRGYARVAAALEPAELEGGDFIDTAFGNITGSSARGALRFQVVDLIAETEARLRLTPSGTPQEITAGGMETRLVPSADSLQLADLLRSERDHVAVYQNGSEDSYVRALLGLWREADRQPELGVRFSATLVGFVEEDSARSKVPAQGALRALRRLVQQSRDKAKELDRLDRESAALETPNEALTEVFDTARQEFLWLQEQIRRSWADTRRRLHFRGANLSR